MSQVLIDKKRVFVAALDEILPGQARRFMVDGEIIAVFRQRNGKVTAMQNACPHRGGSLADGLMGSGRVICPLHAHKFDLCSGSGSEKHECVRTYVVEIDQEMIFLIL